MEDSAVSPNISSSEAEKALFSSHIITILVFSVVVDSLLKCLVVSAGSEKCGEKCCYLLELVVPAV